MTDKRIAEQHHATFERIRQQDAAGTSMTVAINGGRLQVQLGASLKMPSHHAPT